MAINSAIFDDAEPLLATMMCGGILKYGTTFNAEDMFNINFRRFKYSSTNSTSPMNLFDQAFSPHFGLLKWQIDNYLSSFF